MRTVNIHEAKTHLSRLIEQVAAGEPFIIAKAGKPLAKVVPIDAPEPAKMTRLGFLAGQIEVPADFDRMGEVEILHLFKVEE
jgi:prevent-host-death family protein